MRVDDVDDVWRADSVELNEETNEQSVATPINATFLLVGHQP